MRRGCRCLPRPHSRYRGLGPGRSGGPTDRESARDTRPDQGASRGAAARAGDGGVTGHMGRRYASEFVGTFGIVAAPVALSATGRFSGGDAGLMAAAWVSGLAVLAMIYTFG